MCQLFVYIRERADSLRAIVWNGLLKENRTKMELRYLASCARACTPARGFLPSEFYFVFKCARCCKLCLQFFYVKIQLGQRLAPRAERWPLTVKTSVTLTANTHTHTRGSRLVFYWISQRKTNHANVLSYARALAHELSYTWNKTDTSRQISSKGMSFNVLYEKKTYK